MTRGHQNFDKRPYDIRMTKGHIIREWQENCNRQYKVLNGKQANAA